MSGRGTVASPVTVKAKQLIERIDALDVEHKWPAGVHINWETGEPDGVVESKTGMHTHCSTFVAAAAKRFGIYMLRPPEHGQDYLASAQSDWLKSAKAKSMGWTPVSNEILAQESANQGNLVVAVYKNNNKWSFMAFL